MSLGSRDISPLAMFEWAALNDLGNHCNYDLPTVIEELQLSQLAFFSSGTSLSAFWAPRPMLMCLGKRRFSSLSSFTFTNFVALVAASRIFGLLTKRKVLGNTTVWKHHFKEGTYVTAGVK